MNIYDSLLSDRKGIAAVLTSFCNPGNEQYAAEYENALLALVRAYNYRTPDPFAANYKVSKDFSVASYNVARALKKQAKRLAGQLDKEQSAVNLIIANTGMSDLNSPVRQNRYTLTEVRNKHWFFVKVGRAYEDLSPMARAAIDAEPDKKEWRVELSDDSSCVLFIEIHDPTYE